MKLTMLLALAVPALFSANVAFGQAAVDNRSNDAEYQVAGQEDASYSVTFLDDLLKGDGIDSSAALIKVRPPSTRSLLIRPRTSFVMEMFKSVENI